LSHLLEEWQRHNRGFGTIGVPDGKGYTNIYSNTATFAALKSDGSIASWGSGSADMPSDSGYTYG
jgi:hypothetical protein